MSAPRCRLVSLARGMLCERLPECDSRGRERCRSCPQYRLCDSRGDQNLELVMVPVKKQPFSNHGIVTLAVYLLGGDSRPVDTEDVAVKVNEIAPGRFTWRKYADQINLEIVRVCLSDAKKHDKGSYLSGSGKDGWLLTTEGLLFVNGRLHELGTVDLSRRLLSQREQHQRRIEKTRMLSSEAYVRFREEGADAVTINDTEAFFRLNEYVVGKARDRKIARILNTYGDDAELGEVVRELSKRIKER